ncbi:MAG: gliding motility-associated C-terminal domain-containing protein [Marinifilaceae bacterium]|jgi:gliding motility-associated-like protein|nr:gliding motility-associated C-terminal domain-containing protein [Marinifilaceae bacterium]
MNKKLIIIITCLLLPLISVSQGIYVKEGNMSVSDNTHLIINDCNLEADSKLMFKNNSVLFLQTTSGKILIYGDILLQNVILNGNCYIDSDITVNGDIEFKSGIIDLGGNILYLNGLLKNEREDSHIFSSSTGELVVNESLQNNIKHNPGNLGLDILLKNHSGKLEIRRSNAQISYDGNKSILRNFTFNPSIDVSNMGFKYFDKEVNNLDTKDFAIWIDNGTSWNPIKSLSHVSNEIITGEADDISSVTIFSTKINVGADFPTGFTPNDDGVNDYYVIQGIDKYPNNEFVVFNQWGDIVYRSSPYKNDWNGVSTKGVSLSSEDKLLDGTYFYYFFKDKKNKKDVVKGFIEILTK